MEEIISHLVIWLLMSFVLAAAANESKFERDQLGVLTLENFFFLMFEDCEVYKELMRIYQPTNYKDRKIFKIFEIIPFTFKKTYNLEILIKISSSQAFIIVDSTTHVLSSTSYASSFSMTFNFSIFHSKLIFALCSI